MDRCHRIFARRIGLSNSRFDVMLDHVAGPDGAKVPDFLMVRLKVRLADGVAGVCVLPVLEDGRVGLMRVHRPHCAEPL